MRNLPSSKHRIRERIRQRAEQGDSLSDAEEKVLVYQLTGAEPLTGSEKDISIAIDEQADVKTVGIQLKRGLPC